MVDRLRRVPPWAWLTVIVAGSIVVRAWLGSRMPAPFIFTDELQYQENARSLAAGSGIRVRDERLPPESATELLAALLTMLNSCAAGVTVVNIDNGFGAAYAATMMNRIGVE